MDRPTHLTFVLVCCVVISRAWAASVCPVHSTSTQPVRHHGDTCFQFHLKETREFSAAQDECRAQGGNEVIIRTAEMQQFLYKTIEQELHYTGVVWIGLNDVAHEGLFHWVDGSALGSFTNWASGEPSNHGAKDCVVMDMSNGGQWRDFVCEDFLIIPHPHPFICEFGTVERGTVRDVGTPSTVRQALTALDKDKKPGFIPVIGAVFI